MEEERMENLNMETEEVQHEEDVQEQKHEKLFTQEQVNEIIKKRLKEQKKEKENEQNFEEREVELSKREKRMDCREYVVKKGYPEELLDIIDTSDVEEFKQKADKANGVYERQPRRMVAPLADVEQPVEWQQNAFENKKHTPKQWR